MRVSSYIHSSMIDHLETDKYPMIQNSLAGKSECFGHAGGGGGGGVEAL